MENTQTNNVEVNNENKINYQFTAIPTNFIYILDNCCYKLFSLLIQEESYWKSINRLDSNGYFFQTVEEQMNVLNINRNEVNMTIESLYINNIIDVISEGCRGQRKTNRFKINWNKVIELSNINITEVIKTGIKIEKCPRGTKCTYSKVNTEVNTEVVTKVITEVNTKVTTKCDTILYNTNNIDNKNNIYNKEKENIIINNNIKEKEISKVQIEEKENLDNDINYILDELFEDSSANEELKQIETNTNDLRGYSKEDKETIGINEKEAYKGSFEYNNELNDNSNEEEYNNKVSASQNEVTSTKNNSLIETYNNNIMDTSTKENYINDKNTKNVTVPATLGKELNNSNGEIYTNEAVGSDLKNNSNGDKETIVNSAKVALIASNYTNNELNEYSNEEIYIKVKPFKKNNKVMDNNKEDNKVLQGKTSQSATREVQANFDSAAARPAASAEDVKMIIDTVIKMIAKLKNFNTISDFDYSAKQIYKITDTLEQSEEVINNNDIRSTVELCNNTIEVLRNDLIKEVNKKKQTKQYYY